MNKDIFRLSITVCWRQKAIALAVAKPLDSALNPVAAGGGHGGALL